MANKNVLLGKGSLNDLENLHGQVTKVYIKAVGSLCEQIEYSDEQQSKYLEDVERAELAGEDKEDIIKPNKFIVDKDALALLKNAQSFLKENDVQMDVVKGSTGAKKLRSNIQQQLANKRQEM